jgi:hypothetical protein
VKQPDRLHKQIAERQQLGIGLGGVGVADKAALHKGHVHLATAQALQSYNLTAADKALVQIVNTFEFDAGVVTTIPNFNLARDIDTGAATAYSPRSGLFVDMSMWNFAALQGYENADLPDLGGGPRGYIDVVYLIRCLNALGQFRVLSDGRLTALPTATIAAGTSTESVAVHPAAIRAAAWASVTWAT